MTDGSPAGPEPVRAARRARTGMREVAEAAGVAMSSVSRVLSDHPDVSQAMRDRVLAAVEALQYRPDMLAQGLRRQETMTVGCVVGDISNPVVSQMVKGAEIALRDSGYSMLLTNSIADPELDRRHVELLSQRRVDGLIVLPVSETHEPTNRALEELDVPVVVLERDLPAAIGASSVFSDHRAGMTPVVDHLLELGHRRIALIGGQHVRPTRERAAALGECFDRRVLPHTYRVVEGTYSAEHGAQSTRALLESAEPPTAIIAGSNQIMQGALEEISSREIALGAELSFVGCDDISIAQLYRPPISVLDRDRVELGRAAAESLLDLLRDDLAPPSVVSLPMRFIPRPSCGPPP